MIPRTLEPEVMDSADEAREYDAMDHAAVNSAFVDDFLSAVEQAGLADGLHRRDQPLSVFDCGTGTALIPIVLARRPVAVRIVATDLAEEMLRLAAENVAQAGLQDRIALHRADCKRLPFEDRAFDAVISNTLLHHLPEPQIALAEMLRILRPGGVLFVRDLFRPETTVQVDKLVQTHAGGASERQQALLRDSLHAALTLDEIRRLLADFGLPSNFVTQTSDRHWTIAGIPFSSGDART